ncbi:MAG: phosphoribosylformylglycinamidine synthase, partial [Gammaproteobacteria bacterium]|nr:phosphoribosylformylglycinamidine synthase [Gammaproteobacteria bacterium]
FNNEFGRPNLCGYFRSFSQQINDTVYGYHKPIMLAGGMGNIRAIHVNKQNITPGTHIIVLGGPAMLIGMGGGAASSMASGSSDAQLDSASVQRHNPEMQRRCQEVIDACWALGDANPIVSIHDVGAGGLSNAVPEIIHDWQRGGQFELRKIPSDESSMSPIEIWCNESQERYVLAIADKGMEKFMAIAQRERAPYAVLGKATEQQQLQLDDQQFMNKPIDLPMDVLFGKTPKMHRSVTKQTPTTHAFDDSQIDLADAIKRVLQHPTVADKKFLITIGDRSITGMVCRDQLVGPWQVAVADVAVTANSFQGYKGEAMAMGERTPSAIVNAPAAARMAVAEAITNIAAADISELSAVKLSANWMAAAGAPGQDAALYEAVQAVGMELCPALGICIPVGKDSMSMRTVWQEDDKTASVISPVSLIISAFSPVDDVRNTLTPQLRTDQGDTDLILLDLAQGNNRLGLSILAQVYGQCGDEVADCDDAQQLKRFFDVLQRLKKQQLLLAYHDRSDGGLLATLCEMAFAGHTGITVNIVDDDMLASLFSEELGAVIQIKHQYHQQVIELLVQYQVPYQHLGKLNNRDEVVIAHRQQIVFRAARSELQQWWSATSYHLQAQRDNTQCAEQEFASIVQPDPGLSIQLSFDVNDDIAAPYIAKNIRPKLAVLREQGVNGHVEMAAAFDRAGFLCIDVHMSDIIAGAVKLDDFVGLVACGGFSYGDVLGAGRGWASAILHNTQAYDQFSQFFQRSNTFTLGVCNGCQMLSQLTTLMPGTQHWPQFARNQSQQFEARFSLVRIADTSSLFFKGMTGSQFAIPVAHGEGRAVFTGGGNKENLVCMQYIDNDGQVTEQYPANPNGSPQGVAAFTTTDGRVTIMMPHPERAFRAVINSWHPDQWCEDAPSMRMFRNARAWVN